ncbi:MAG: GlsB/YeaQ/YmgE family stress response membrane protein [Desulfuromonas sp.]|nr:MAG: GlsB/YeaQ/YmgE family stress response membrane protein [Desulfuromonas sp.]
MNIEQLVILLIVGAIAGWLAGVLMKKRGFGLPVNVIIGIVGAAIGRYLFDLLNISMRGLVGAIITATCGAVVLLFAVSLIKK